MSAIDWTVVSRNDLDEPTESGGRLRAFCRCHHHNRGPSIAIEANGFGRCFRCGAQVLVRELNQEAAANIERGQARLASGQIYVPRPQDFLKPARATRQPPPRSIEHWKQHELELLRSLQDSMQARLHDERSRLYIEGRGLSLETAQHMGVSYIPDKEYSGKYASLARWRDHIIFPVGSPDGLHFAGRNLHLWQPGMDENTHKDMLEEKDIRRWRKTHVGGWFNYQAMEHSADVTFVEGAFDALALIEAGIEDTVAIIGTALTVDWLPKHLELVTLAFDGDEKGIEKSTAARNALYEHGYKVDIISPPDDVMGKDWSERYRMRGVDGLEEILPVECATCGEPRNGGHPEECDRCGQPMCEECWNELTCCKYCWDYMMCEGE